MRLRKAQKMIPANTPEFKVERIAELLPTNARIMKDMFNGRWRVWVRAPGPPPGPWRDLSRSFGARGHFAAVKECLIFAWRKAEMHGEKCSVENLL